MKDRFQEIFNIHQPESQTNLELSVNKKLESKKISSITLNGRETIYLTEKELDELTFNLLRLKHERQQIIDRDPE
jgi:hypothetical protein